MELNGGLSVSPSSPNGDSSSDFIVLGDGSGEFHRNMETDDIEIEDLSQRIRLLLVENKELRENAQKNTAACAHQYKILKEWKEQEAEKQERLKTQYNQAKDIVKVLRDEIAKLKHKQEAPRQEGSAQSEDDKLEMDMLTGQLSRVKQENEDLQKKVESMSQSMSSSKKMTSSSMEVNVVSHGTIETQTDIQLPETYLKELENTKAQANQLMLDLESLQKLKDDIEQQRAKLEQERDDLMNKIIERENITLKLLREKREVVAMNNQLNMEVDRLVTENKHLWDSEKEKVESLRNYDTVQDFSREIDQRLEMAPLPSLPADKETEDKTDGETATASGGVASGGITSGGLSDRSQKTIQQILLQLQEQQEENQKVSAELCAKRQQITQLQSEIDELKSSLKDRETDIVEVKLKCAQEIDEIEQTNTANRNKADRLASEEKHKLEDNITALSAEVAQKVTALEELRKYLDNTTESYQKQVTSLSDLTERRKAEIADQAQVLATVNNTHRQQIEEMRREILHLSESAAHRQQKAMSESQSSELLQIQINTLISDLRSESTRLEEKTKLCHDYKSEMDRLNLELQRHQTKTNEVVESMRLQIGSLQSKLHAAEENVLKKSKDIDDIKRSQSQLLEDYQDLFTNHETLVKQKSERENQLRQRMTQLQSESINSQEECKALRDEIRIKQEEIEDLFRRIRVMQAEKDDASLYKIQADVFREDFTREREARERAHEQLAETRASFDELLLQKQRLDEDLRRYSQQQIAQMQSRDEYVVVPQTGQRQQYSREDEQTRRPSPGRQPLPQEHICPKCGVPFPNLDALQIHVFTCLDED